MPRLRSFVGLPFRDQCLLVEAVASTALASLALVAIPFKWIAPWLGRHMSESSRTKQPDDQTILDRVQSSIRIASRHVPWKAECLAQAIAATIMLRWRGIEGTVYLGIAKEGQADVVGHAWLRSGTKIVTGGGGLDRLSVVSTFAFPANRRSENGE